MRGGVQPAPRTARSLPAARSAAAPEPSPPPLPAEEPKISLSDLRADAEAAATALAEQMESDGFFGNAESIKAESLDEIVPDVEASSAVFSSPGVEFLAPTDESAPAEELAALPSAPPPVPPAEEPVQVDFEQTAVPSTVDAVKHVKVRSNVDILSELEKLRKNATLKPMPEAPSRRRAPASDISIDDLLPAGTKHRKEVQR